MALSSMSSIGLVAFAAASIATGSLWSERDQGAKVTKNAEVDMLSSACIPGRSKPESGPDAAPSTAQLGCQAYFQSYAAYAGWAGIFHSGGR